MSWSLNASGHIQPAEGTDAHAVEVELFRELQKVLTDPKFGASASKLYGSHVSGEPHKSAQSEQAKLDAEEAADPCATGTCTHPEHGGNYRGEHHTTEA